MVIRGSTSVLITLEASGIRSSYRASRSRPATELLRLLLERVPSRWARAAKKRLATSDSGARPGFFRESVLHSTSIGYQREARHVRYRSSDEDCTPSEGLITKSAATFCRGHLHYSRSSLRRAVAPRGAFTSPSLLLRVSRMCQLYFPLFCKSRYPITPSIVPLDICPLVLFTQLVEAGHR